MKSIINYLNHMTGNNLDVAVEAGYMDTDKKLTDKGRQLEQIANRFNSKSELAKLFKE